MKNGNMKRLFTSLVVIHFTVLRSKKNEKNGNMKRENENSGESKYLRLLSAVVVVINIFSVVMVVDIHFIVLRSKKNEKTVNEKRK